MKPASAAKVAMAPDRVGLRHRRCFEITGRVQGVGFRPFLFRLARARNITGRVLNRSGLVVLDAEGYPARLDELPALIRTQAPPAARVDQIAIRERAPVGYDTLRLAQSELADDPLHSGTQDSRETRPAELREVSPDLAPCEDCRREILDPASRRFGYAFTSCTACGPRFTIINDLPYDRVRTSMRDFALCAECSREYVDPADRRFHHEANCCPRCGPRLQVLDARGTLVNENKNDTGDILDLVARELVDGKIIALKGVGGYQLLASASRPETLQRLREAKGRPRKPFALLLPDLATARRLVRLSALEERALGSPAAPIMIASALPAAREEMALDKIAPGNPCLGVMLPASPLHQLLAWRTGPVVCTSGNRESEPIQIEDEEARSALTDCADLFLVHDRRIVRHADDSILRVMADRPVVLRRARGFAPVPLLLPEDCFPLPATLALGAHAKNAPAIGAGRRIVLGQHVGDLDTRDSRTLLRRSADDLIHLSGLQPSRVACDLHPEYASTREAEERAGSAGPIRIQHHRAHVLAVLAEHGIVGGPASPSTTAPILGVAWDGSGYGPGGELWGGEFFLVSGTEVRRIAGFRPIPLIGGEAAIRDPGRIALAILDDLVREEPERKAQIERLSCLAGRSQTEINVLRTMHTRGINVAFASSAGRLFDAFAVLLGAIDRVSFEGEAAMALEYLAHEHFADDHLACENISDAEPLPFEIQQIDDRFQIDWRPALRRTLDLLERQITPARIAFAFHAGLIESIRVLATQYSVQGIALAGGCFQNKLLLERAHQLLEAQGHRVYSSREVPPGDGGIAVGQVIAAAYNL